MFWAAASSGREAVYVRSGADHGLPAGDAGYAGRDGLRPRDALT